MTLKDFSLRFQGHDVFSTLNVSETAGGRAIVTIERQWEVPYALSNGDMSNVIDGPLARISRSQHFRSRISQKTVCLGYKVAIEHY